MQARPDDAVALAHGRARKWLRVFPQLVRVLDRLETRHESAPRRRSSSWCSARSRLETPEPVVAFTPDDSAELLEGGRPSTAARRS